MKCKIFEKLIVTDLKRDMTAYKIPESRTRLQMSYYAPSHLISVMFGAYGQLIVYKGLSLASNHPAYYPEMSHWLTIDSTFILPLFLMGLNYILVQKSDHPFLINVRERWSPLTKSFCILYGSALAIVLPKTYLISYCSFGIAHLLVRSARQLYMAGTQREKLLK